jgi:type IV secretory pathway VirB9-like protein
MRAFIPMLLLTTTLTACAAPQLPPALPDERRWPSEAPGFATSEPLRPTLPDLPPAWPPLLQPVALEPPAALSAKAKKLPRPERPDIIMREANREALVTPGRTGYFGGSAIQRYVYQPGKVYVVTSSPSHPTTILLPPGERLAAAPIIDPETWEVSATEMAGEEHRSEAIILRPLKAGLESTMPLLTLGGRAYFIRLRSQEALGNVAVTWELPTVQVLQTEPASKTSKTPQGPPRLQTPTISLDRLHTGYHIEVVSKHRPAWVPKQVLDDGSRTLISFAEPLTYTSAPAVLTLHPDKTPGIVEFSTYSNPDHPEQGLYYIIEGLWPELRLRGGGNEEVKISRIPAGR